MKQNGYIMPFIMGLSVIVIFSVVGIMEFSRTSEKQVSNEQLRDWVDGVARDELAKQELLLESNKGLANKTSRSLTPILFSDGCDSSNKKSICQKVTLTLLNDLTKPSGLTTGVFKGWRFRLVSEAEHVLTGTKARYSTELSYAHLSIMNGRDIALITEEQENNPDYVLISSRLRFTLPKWWDLTITAPVTEVCFHSFISSNAKAYVVRYDKDWKYIGGWTSDQINVLGRRYWKAPPGENVQVYYGTCGLSGFSPTCKYATTRRVKLVRGAYSLVSGHGSLFSPTISVQDYATGGLLCRAT